MSWGDIFFGFRGRISRKTYWTGSIAVALIGLAFSAFLAYLATGNPIAPDVWERPEGKARLWMPVWLAYFALLAWPSAALALKRLHDRNRGPWLWYVYYAVSFLVSLLPARSEATGEVTDVAAAAVVPLAAFSIYVVFQLGVLRGTKGSNAYGDDPLPADYYGGDYSFLSLMLAPEGRISRSKWWRGALILTFVTLVTSAITFAILNAFVESHPDFLQKLADPEWVRSKEAALLTRSLLRQLIGPAIVFLLILWSFTALGVKRLHDRGLSSWLMLVVILPALGVIISPELGAAFDLGDNPVRLALLLFMASVIWSVLQFGILRGETGPNRHGPDPLAG